MISKENLILFGEVDFRSLPLFDNPPGFVFITGRRTFRIYIFAELVRIRVLVCREWFLPPKLLRNWYLPLGLVRRRVFRKFSVLKAEPFRWLPYSYQKREPKPSSDYIMFVELWTTGRTREKETDSRCDELLGKSSAA